MSTNGPLSHHQGADERPRSDRGPDPHRATVIAAEVRRLERRLLAIGPMPRAKLAESCGAERWREGTFEEAIREGVRLGTLRQLPLGWIEANTATANGQPR
jgi:hypothetical protein